MRGSGVGFALGAAGVGLAILALFDAGSGRAWVGLSALGAAVGLALVGGFRGAEGNRLEAGFGAAGLIYAGVWSGVNGGSWAGLAGLAVAFGVGAFGWAAVGKRGAWAFLTVAVLAGLIGALSGSLGGAGRMQWFFETVVGLSRESASGVVFGVRKGVHVGCYAVLAGAGALGLARNGVRGRWAAGLGLGLALGFAVSDEMNQMGLADRSGSWVDVGVDGMGALLGLAAVSRGWRGEEER